MNQEEAFLAKRLMELANQSYQRNSYTFSDFLSSAELSVFFQIEKQLGNIPYTIFGQDEGYERQMIRFGNEATLGYEQSFPICCIEIKPGMLKFAENLTHRDYLGALMHLGIERSHLGDISIREKSAFVFCKESLGLYITENLDKVKHTSVVCRICDTIPDYVEPGRKTEYLITGSLRVDGILAKLYHLSRSQSLTLFKEKKVFINGRSIEQGSYVLKIGDTVTARGYGKFVFQEVERETKKGKLQICVTRFVS